MNFPTSQKTSILFKSSKYSSTTAKLFSKSDLQPYTVDILFLLGNSDQAMIEVKYSIHIVEKTEKPPPRTMYGTINQPTGQDFQITFPYMETYSSTIAV